MPYKPCPLRFVYWDKSKPKKVLEGRGTGALFRDSIKQGGTTRSLSSSPHRPLNASWASPCACVVANKTTRQPILPQMGAWKCFGHRHRLPVAPCRDSKRLVVDWASRCQMPSTLVPVFEDIDHALAQAFIFTEAAIKNSDDMLGEHGSRASMIKLNNSLASCFDFSQLIYKIPTQQQVGAFLQVCEILHPILASTEWPSKYEFPLVVHSWPKPTEWKDLAQEYVLLCLRLRNAKTYWPGSPKEQTAKNSKTMQKKNNKNAHK